MGDYYGYTWQPGNVRIAEHDTYVPEGRTHPQRVTDFSDPVKVAHIRVLWPMIQGLDAVKITDLAQSWRTLSTQLTTAKGGLDRAGGRLAPQWTGTASRAFLERVGGALYSLDQWIDAASTNAATINRLADDVRTTQQRVEGIYRAWLMESANEKAKRDADVGEITSQDWNDLIGLLSKENMIADGGFLHRWARESVPQEEIDRKYTAQALPLVKKLADHFSSAAATGISLPGKFKGPTTFKLVQPTFGGAPDRPAIRPPAPAIPAVTPPSVPVPPVGARPGAPPGAPAARAVPPALSGTRTPSAPALPSTRQGSGPQPAALPASASARPALPALPGRTASRAARPAVPPLAGQGRRGSAPGKPAVPALPGRTRAPGAARTTSTRGATGRPAVPPAVGPRLGGRTGQRSGPTQLGQGRPAGGAGRPAVQPQLPGRIGAPPGRAQPPGTGTPGARTPGTGALGTTPPEFGPVTPSALDGAAAEVGARPPAPPSLGGRRGHPTPSDASARGTAANPQLTGRVAPHGRQLPDTRPAPTSRSVGPDPVTAPEEAFAPAESAPPVIERPETPAPQPAGPALGRS